MNYLSQQIPLGKHSFKSAALALSARGIRSTTHGSDLMVAPELASVARKILDESEPFGNLEPENRPRRAGNDEPERERDAGTDGLRKQIRDLQKRCDDLTEENRELRKGKRSEREQDLREREHKSADALAASIRSKAATMGCSVGDLCDQLDLSASDVRRFGFDNGDMLPTQFARAVGRVPHRVESAIVDDGDSVSCSLMSRDEASRVYADTQRTIERLGR